MASALIDVDSVVEVQDSSVVEDVDLTDASGEDHVEDVVGISGADLTDVDSVVDLTDVAALTDLDLDLTIPPLDSLIKDFI